MSYESMIAKADTRCDIKYYSESTGAGGQLTKTWNIRYNNIPCRLNAVKDKSSEEILYYDAAKVFANFVVYISYLSGILTHDRVFIGSREFDIKKIDDWDLQGKYLRIALKEVTDI